MAHFIVDSLASGPLPVSNDLLFIALRSWTQRKRRPRASELVANGPYVTAFAVSALHSSVLRSTLKVLPIDLPKRLEQVAILTLKNRTLAPVAHCFIESAREIAATMGER